MKGSAWGRIGFEGGGYDVDWAAQGRQRRLPKKRVLMERGMRSDMDISMLRV